MNSAQEELARRKELLLARASLQRLEALRDLHALRDSLRWPRAGLAFATSAPVRSAFFGLLLRLAGRHRAGRVAVWAFMGVALLRLLRRRGATATTSPDADTQRPEPDQVA